jgi:hypothetical protein
MQKGIMTNDHNTIFDTARGPLSSLFDLAPEDERLWRDDELGAILRHQLTTPLQVDLINLERGLAIKVRNLAEAQGLTLKSFGDLLAHPNPPVELLKITKDFAKACRLSPRGPLPREIASVLYFASIAAALVRCRRRITGLTNDALEEGLHWVLARPWLDAPIRTLVEESLQLLHTHSGERA